MEDDDLVDAVKKLRPEYALHFVHNAALHALIILLRVVPRAETEALWVHDGLCAGVGRHDDAGVLEINLFPVRLGDAAFVQHLQQDIEDIRMCLLDLVEQDDAVGVPSHLLRELPALIVADIAGR